MALADIGKVFHHPNLGLLLLRLSVGGFFIYYGIGKFLGGEQALRGLGARISHLGITVTPESTASLIFGLLAAITELLGGLLLLLGVAFRPALVALMGVMVVATIFLYQVTSGDVTRFGHPLIYLLVMGAMLFAGPGKISIQKD